MLGFGLEPCVLDSTSGWNAPFKKKQVFQNAGWSGSHAPFQNAPFQNAGWSGSHAPFKKKQVFQNAGWSNQRFGNYLGSYV